MIVPRRSPEPKIRLTEVRVRGRTLVAVRAKKLPMAMLPITDRLEGDEVGLAKRIEDTGEEVAEHEGNVEGEQEK